MTKQQYKKNISTEKKNQKLLHKGLQILFNHNGIKVIADEIATDKELQNKGMDRILVIEDKLKNRTIITVDDKNQKSVHLVDSIKGKQSDRIYLEYQRAYKRPNNKVRISNGIFSKSKENDLLAILTGDNFLIVFDMYKFKDRWFTCNEGIYKSSLIVDYGFTTDYENETYTVNKIQQDVYKRDNFNEYHFMGYYLRVTYSELIQDDRFSDLFSIVDIDNEKVIY